MGICELLFSLLCCSVWWEGERLTNQPNRKCKSLTAYASLTTVGDQSWYEVEEDEVVHGAKLVQRNDW